MRNILMAVIFFITQGAHAAVNAAIEASKISAGDTFRLTLSQDDAKEGGVPDLTVLQKDFVIVGTERNVSYTIINGQSQSLSQWIISLKPKTTGQITIPPIRMGASQTQPIMIEVSDSPSGKSSSGDWGQDSDDVFMTTEVSGKNYYINQEIIYTVKLYNSKRLIDAAYEGPEVQDALVIPLGDSNRYQTEKNNRTYVVEEQSYAIFPQKSGTLSIKSPVFTALIYDINPQKVRIHEKPTRLDIKPVPKNLKAKHWLPATQVKLVENYEQTEQKLNQGSTVTRWITIEATGIPAQLLPDLTLENSEYYKAYTEKGAERNDVVQGDLASSKKIKVTYLFNKAGNVSLPEVRLRWFNTKTNKEEQAILPPRSFEITATGSAPVSNEPAPAPNQTVVSPPSDNKTSQWPWIIAGVFALAWLVTVILWLMQKRGLLSSGSQYKSALDVLNKACRECNPTKARDALIQWARLQWPDASVLNLSDVTQLARDIQLKKQLNQLSQVLYKTDQRPLWRGDDLWRCIQGVRKQVRSAKKKTSSLPPMNPF